MYHDSRGRGKDALFNRLLNDLDELSVWRPLIEAAWSLQRVVPIQVKFPGSASDLDEKVDDGKVEIGDLEDRPAIGQSLQLRCLEETVGEYTRSEFRSEGVSGPNTDSIARIKCSLTAIPGSFTSA
jgi:hypothetical protein